MTADVWAISPYDLSVTLLEAHLGTDDSDLICCQFMGIFANQFRTGGPFPSTTTSGRVILHEYSPLSVL